MIQKLNLKIELFALLWFYIGWFGSVFLGQNQLSVFSLIFPIIGWLIFVKTHKVTQALAIKLVFLVSLGACFDLLLSMTGQMHFKPETNLVPLWLISIWLLFATILPLAQAGFKNRYLLAGFLAALAAPLNYISGRSFDLLFFENKFSILYHAVFWGLYFPFCLYVINQEPIKNDKEVFPS